VIRHLISLQKPPLGLPKYAQGFVLIIALIVLAAMSLAAVALVRTVDTTTMLARNISFKRDALNRTDIAIDAGLQNFRAGAQFAAGANTMADDASRNYSAVLLPSDPDGIPQIIKSSTFSTTWTANPVSTELGMSAVYLIERLCSKPETSTVKNCLVGERVAQGGSQPADRPEQIAPAMYRITARVTGPRQTTSFVQLIFTLQSL
jgi:type IV pilus assembly protein PilX